MKSYLKSELTDLVQRIESQAVFEALNKVLYQLDRKADIIENLLYSDEARCIFNHSRGKMFDLIFESRSKLHVKQRTIYEIASTIYEIQRKYI